MVEPRDGTDLHRSVVRERNAVELVGEAMDGDEVSRCPLTLAKLHEYVRAAGDDLGGRVLRKGLDGVLDARCLVQRFDVIH